MRAPAAWLFAAFACCAFASACQSPGPAAGGNGGVGPSTPSPGASSPPFGGGAGAAGGAGGVSAPTGSSGDEIPRGGSGGGGGGTGGASANDVDAQAAVDAAAEAGAPPSASPDVCPAGRKLIWRLDFTHPGWNGGAAGVKAAIEAAGGALDKVTGTDHASVVDDADRGKALLVRYPPGSGSQDCVDLKQCVTAGGIVFFLPVPDGGGVKSALLSYWVKFDPAFEWVKGGKLPGLCGHGCPIAGAKVAPDRFSLRYMWRPGGEAVVYSYLTNPPNSGYGLDMGRGSWSWKNDGVWHHVQEELVLNSGNANDGVIRVWYDKPVTGAPDFEQKNLKYYDRTRYPELGIDTFVFTTFHGGHERAWSPSKEVSAQFADFQICR